MPSSFKFDKAGNVFADGRRIGRCVFTGRRWEGIPEGQAEPLRGRFMEVWSPRTFGTREETAEALFADWCERREK